MSKSEGIINTEILLRYLDDKLDASEQKYIDQALKEDPFLADALEGLAQIEDKTQLPFVVSQLNARLRRQIKKRKYRRPKLAKQPLWMYVLLILLLIIVTVAALYSIIG